MEQTKQDYKAVDALMTEWEIPNRYRPFRKNVVNLIGFFLFFSFPFPFPFPFLSLLFSFLFVCYEKCFVMFDILGTISSGKSSFVNFFYGLYVKKV